MTDTLHTPGPWATDGREAGWDIVGLKGERVATVWREGPNQPASNARLIAAAPDLLAALEAVADYWAGGDVPADIDAAMRAAIAKARGQ